MKISRLLPLAILISSSCAAAPEVETAQPGPVCEESEIQGSVSDVTVASSELDGIQVGALVTCDTEKGAYLPLEGPGWRTLVMGRGDVDGLAGCTVDAVRAAPEDGCPKVQLDSFGKEVAAQMQASGLQAGGVGLGACGQVGDDYDAWNASIVFSDWRLVDPAARIAAGLMAELEIGKRFGVSTKQPMCFQLLEGKRPAE